MREKNINPQSRTDWERLAAMTDDEIDYSDIPALDETFFERATLHAPETQSIVLEPDVFTWFEHQGKNYPSLINAILRRYVTQRNKKKRTPRESAGSSRN